MSEYFDIDIMFNLPNDKPLDKFLMQYDIVHIHKQLDKEGKIADLIKFLGIKLVVDVDDNYWLSPQHPMYASAKAEHWEIPIMNHLKKADLCTTTTPIFASQIAKECNKNVAVFPNAIDPEAEQFKPKDIRETDKIRFGLICGSTHLHDLKLMEGMLARIKPDNLKKIQFVLCGFDTRGNKTIRYADTGKVETRPIEPTESVWYEYEKIVTDKYKIVSPEHKDFLMKFIPQSDYPNHDENYRRCWTKDIEEYAVHYNNIDVLLVPLCDNNFNKVKSQLKVIEAGFFNKAIIASNFGPYTIDLKPMITKGNEYHEDGNALLCDFNKGAKQWAKYINYLVENPDKLEKLRENLHNTVKDTYNIATVC
ncbi:MAG: hypothetical protein MJ231_07835 [bacterium]|nr:hypothetical protein [bacterium]